MINTLIVFLFSLLFSFIVLIWCLNKPSFLKDFSEEELEALEDMLNLMEIEDKNNSSTKEIEEIKSTGKGG